MKALVLENDFQIENCIKAFLKDKPGLFKEVEEFVCLNEFDSEDVVKRLITTDAVLLSSTFINIPQLTFFTKVLNGPLFKNKKLNIYVWDLERHLSNWLKNESISICFTDYEGFINDLIRLFENHYIYTLKESEIEKTEDLLDLSLSRDSFTLIKRNKVISKAINLELK